MNKIYAKTLLLTLLICVGLFQLVRGIKEIRSRQLSTWAGILRIISGIVLGILIPLGLLLGPLYFS